jgi:hypothetical protein
LWFFGILIKLDRRRGQGLLATDPFAPLPASMSQLQTKSATFLMDCSGELFESGEMLIRSSPEAGRQELATLCNIGKTANQQTTATGSQLSVAIYQRRCGVPIKVTHRFQSRGADKSVA